MLSISSPLGYKSSKLSSQMPRKSSISEPYIHAPAPAKAKAAPAKTPIKAAVKVFAPEDPAPPPLTSKAKSALYETTLQSLRKALGSSETRVARYADKTLEALTKQHIVRFTAKSNLPPKHVTTLEELLDLMPGKKAESTVKEKEERCAQAQAYANEASLSR